MPHRHIKLLCRTHYYLPTRPDLLKERSPDPFSKGYNPAQVFKVEIAGLSLTPSSLPIFTHFLGCQFWHWTVSRPHISQPHYRCPLTASHLLTLSSPSPVFVYTRLAGYATSLLCLKTITTCSIKHKWASFMSSPLHSENPTTIHRYPLFDLINYAIYSVPWTFVYVNF